MKNYLRNFLKITATIFMLMVFAGCQDFLDINDDPNNPTDVRIMQLLPTVEERLARNLGMSGLSNSASFLIQHNVTRGDLNDYNVTPSSAQGVWNSLYNDCLTDLREMERISTEQDYPHYLGVTKILRAYIYSILVDYWGDVPFTEAVLGSGNTTPVFDSGADVYDAVFDMLDAGVADLNKTTTFPIRGDDKIYSGDAAKWRKFANTLKLKLLNQVRLVRDVDAEVAQVLASELISTQAEDFQLAYGTSTSPDTRHPFYPGQYAAGSKTSPNPYFYEVLMNMNTFGHGGDIFDVQDPRIPYYIYNQTLQGQATPNPTAYRITNGPFISIYSFSFNIDPNEGFDQSGFASVQGLYPIGGKYDDGLGADAVNNGYAATPQRMLTYFASLFIQAELAQVGVSAGDPAALLQSAVMASFAKVNQVAAAASAPLISSAARDAYVTEVMTKFGAADDDGKLQIIMTQKWIASYGFSVDAFTDYRRTGWPLLHDGNNDNRPTTVRVRDLVVSYPYPVTEIQLNPKSPGQRNQYLSKVFWQN